MPADILGSEVLETGADGSRAFKFIEGPVFCQLLMADEITRASPRTQSALLQAMQERSVTVAGQPHDLPAPFHVLATQNPIEQEGTYPLPEAQLDRFLLQIDVDYPERDAERDILLATTGTGDAQSHQVFSAADLLVAQQLVRRMPVGEAVMDLILDLVRACRPGEAEAPDSVNASVGWGPGPRAAQGLMLTVRARALLQGRLAPSAEDVMAVARPERFLFTKSPVRWRPAVHPCRMSPKLPNGSSWGRCQSACRWTPARCPARPRKTGTPAAKQSLVWEFTARPGSSRSTMSTPDMRLRRWSKSWRR